MPPCSSAPATARRSTKPVAGQFKHLGKDQQRPKHVREVRVDATDGYEVGQQLGVDLFEAGELVDVTGVSKGHGFTGVIARHNFRRGPKSHGSDHHRAPGSIGAGTYPGRVWKGTRMAGHMGDEQVTVKKLTGREDRPGAQPHPGQGRGARRAQRPAARAEGEVTMPQTTILKADGKEARQGGPGRDPLRRAGQRGAHPPGRDPPAGRPAPRHRRHADAWRGQRRRQEAVAPEGDRPRAPGHRRRLRTGPAVAWSSGRTRAATSSACRRRCGAARCAAS